MGAVHGDLGQIAREKALKSFRGGAIDVLVATDVAARGIDIDDVTHVINYQCPDDETTYVHRIGRTGRAGRTGVAITLVDWDELPRWTMIDTALKLGSPEPAETYSNSPHLYSEQAIPTDATGTVGARRTPTRQRQQTGHDSAQPQTPSSDTAGVRTSTRSRRRTRSGKLVAGQTGGDAAEAAFHGAEPADPPTSAPGATDQGRRRRRRRRTQSADEKLTANAS